MSNPTPFLVVHRNIALVSVVWSLIRLLLLISSFLFTVEQSPKSKNGRCSNQLVLWSSAYKDGFTLLCNLSTMLFVWGLLTQVDVFGA